MSVLTMQALKLAEDGLGPAQIEAQLIGEGYRPDKVREAVASMASTLRDMHEQQAMAAQASGGSSGAGVGNILLGLVLLGLGIVGSFAGPKIFIGAMVVGLFRLVRGFGQLSQG